MTTIFIMTEVLFNTQYQQNKEFTESDYIKHIDKDIEEIIVSYVKRGNKVILLDTFSGKSDEKLYNKNLNKLVSLIEGKNMLNKGILSYEYCKLNNGYNTFPYPGLLYELAIDFELILGKAILIGTEVHKKLAHYSGINLFINVLDLKE